MDRKDYERNRIENMHTRWYAAGVGALIAAVGIVLGFVFRDVLIAVVIGGQGVLLYGLVLLLTRRSDRKAEKALEKTGREGE